MRLLGLGALAFWLILSSRLMRADPAAQQLSTPGANPKISLPEDVPTDAIRSSVYRTGHLEGWLASWRTSEGKLHVVYRTQFLGAVTETESVIELDQSGIPISEQIMGKQTATYPVDERFSVKNAIAAWNNTFEQGQTAFHDDAVYLPMNLNVEHVALLARALLQNKNSLNLLPGGHAGISKLAQEKVEANGKSQTVFLYAIFGIDLLPQYIWLDQQGNFFAGSGAIRDGWEPASKRLLAVEDRVANEHRSRIAKKLGRRPSQKVVFYNANLFEAETATIRLHQTVTIAGTHVESVTPANLNELPRNGEVIDATGKTLLPGLWDMHQHIGEKGSLLDIAAGVTTARDLGNGIDSLLAQRKRIEEDSEIGPRIVLAGMIDAPGPAQGPTDVLVSSAEEARAGVDRYADLGYVQIKIYNGIKPPWIPVIVAEARKRGLRVSGHVPHDMDSTECVELGYDEIQHFSFVLVNFQPDARTIKGPRLPIAFANIQNLDLDSKQVADFTELLKTHHVALDPTLNVMEGIMLPSRSGLQPLYWSFADRLPFQYRRRIAVGFRGAQEHDPELAAGLQRAFPVMLKLLKKFYDAGIPIEAGTDSFAGFGLDRELELDVQAGIPAPATLQLATLGAARLMHMDATLGSIRPGKVADVILVDGDPARDISDIRKVRLTMKGGVIYNPAEVFAELGISQ